MEQGLFRSHSLVTKISRLSWKPALDPILRQMNPLHTSQPMSIRYTLILRTPPMEPGWLSRYTNQATGSTMEESDWISGGGKSVQISSRTLSSGHKGTFPKGRRVRDVKPTTHLHLVSRLNMCGAVTPLTYTSS
jgi:hypothetical protein